AAAPDRLAEDLLRGALRVDIGSVDHVDTMLQAQSNKPSGLLHVGVAHIGKPTSAPERHRSQGDYRDPQTRPAQLPVLHTAILGDQPCACNERTAPSRTDYNGQERNRDSRR